MAIMTRMRDNMPAILIGLVVVFLITIVFEWGMDYLSIKGGRRDIVGIIEGKNITYQEFSELVKRSSDEQKKQSGSDPDETVMRQIREQVWNSLVTQTLVEKEVEKAGLSVTDQEIVDWVKGENPPEFLVQQFRDSTGQFNRAGYENAINDPRNKEVWVQVETMLKQQRVNEKLQSMIAATARVSPGEVEQRFIERNTKINATYAFYDPNRYVADSAVTVTDDDLRKFYNENQELYKAKATRNLKYVVFSDQPTSKDSQDVLSEIDQVKKQLAAGLDFVELQKTYSETPANENFVKHGEIGAEREKAVFSAAVGDVVGPIKEYDGYHLIKLLEEKKGTDPFIRARHILLNVSDPSLEGEVKNKAAELIGRAKKGEDFAQLAKQFSQEPGAAQSGGDIGWFGKGRMVKAFEDAVVGGRVGEIIGPVKTQFGIHVIKIEGKDTRELKISDIHLKIKASGQTKDAAYQNAQDFVYVTKGSKFEKEAEALKLDVRETAPFQKGGMVPGIGFNESLSRFAFNGDVGDVSEVYPIQNGYGVFSISESKKEGVRPLDEVKDGIKPRVLRQKKMELLSMIVTKARTGLNENADMHQLRGTDPLVVVDTSGQFTPGDGRIPSVGRELVFIGAASTLPLQKISMPIEGDRGYYLIKVFTRTAFDGNLFAAQQRELATSMLQEKKQRIIAEWLEELKTKAKIEDNRDMFFR